MQVNKADLIFHPTLQSFNQQRRNAPLTVFSGANNSGKSLALKWLKSALGRKAYMIGPNRFYHVYHFGSSLRNERELDEFENNFTMQFQDERQNLEQNYYDLNRIIANLSNARRNTLFELCGRLIGSTFSLKRVEEDNDLSMRYIDVDGQNLAVSSTGTRLLMTLLGICLDERFDTLLIDEPELGLGPRVQQALSDFLQDTEQRLRYFKHLQRVFIATHSHLFLHRRDISNNFVVSKSGKEVFLSQIKTIADFHRLQFNLLGNSLESMFLPAAVIIAEGKTDHEYIDRLVQLRFPGRRITVLGAKGDGDIKAKLSQLRDAYGDLMKSPFRSRLFVVLDSVHSRGLPLELQSMGVQSQNIAVWDLNGIEFVYPPQLLAEVFACSTAAIAQMEITGDQIAVNGITITKNQLKDEIIKRLSETTSLPPELESKLLKPLGDAIS